jgi:hypothetical protein
MIIQAERLPVAVFQAESAEAFVARDGDGDSIRGCGRSLQLPDHGGPAVNPHSLAPSARSRSSVNRLLMLLGHTGIREVEECAVG